MKLTPWEPDLRTLVDRIELEDIDLQPEFQRQEVWSLPKKRRLIDTVIRGWSIPPVHLVMTPDNKLEVLDGQQRLAAIRDFLAGKFSIDGNITPEDESVSLLHGQFYHSLDSYVRRRIDQYTLRCFRISDFAPEEPSELFYRLNQPTMLTAGEQRNALYGPARAELKELVKYFLQLGNNRNSIGFSNSRLSYDDILARFLFFLEIGSFGTKGSESRISDRFRSKVHFPAYVVQRARESIDLFSRAREISKPIRFNKASLLSWLLFYCRSGAPSEVISFLGDFAELRGANNALADSAFALFDDRSSLRVTDVSSVVFRDVALWYVYYVVLRNKCPPSIPDHLLDRLHMRVLVDKLNFEESATAVIDVDEWSATL